MYSIFVFVYGNPILLISSLDLSETKPSGLLVNQSSLGCNISPASGASMFLFRWNFITLRYYSRATGSLTRPCLKTSLVATGKSEVWVKKWFCKTLQIKFPYKSPVSIARFTKFKVFKVHKVLCTTQKKIFPLRISSVNWPNPQFLVDLVTFTEDVLSEKLHFLCRGD